MKRTYYILDTVGKYVVMSIELTLKEFVLLRVDRSKYKVVDYLTPRIREEFENDPFVQAANRELVA